jgi:NAD(P)-dependent dehydrogenase (short-subunit alcohol dehydrogenase family)
MTVADNSMKGRVCLVTGATAGIGEAVARELAHRGATVVIVGRNEARCQATVDAIRKETGNLAVEYLRADLSSQGDIRRLADEFRQKHTRLHVLVNNAGAMYVERQDSVDGIEMTLALNHLGYFLLTNLLLDLLKVSAPSRIVSVSSRAHMDVKAFDFSILEGEEHDPARPIYGKTRFTGFLYTLFLPPRHPAFVRYAQSKLANMLFTYELARRLDGIGVTVNAAHPGFVASNFMVGNGIFGWFMRLWAGLFAIDVQQGASTPIYLATSPEVEGISGKYFDKQRQAPSSPASYDEPAAHRLWALSDELTEAEPKLATEMGTAD